MNNDAEKYINRAIVILNSSISPLVYYFPLEGMLH